MIIISVGFIAFVTVLHVVGKARRTLGCFKDASDAKVATADITFACAAPRLDAHDLAVAPRLQAHDLAVAVWSLPAESGVTAGVALACALRL